MISASTLNSELINKIAQDFAQATSLAVVVVNIHGALLNKSNFC
ncbi:propanediol utilization transcriptional activator [Klebsiella pneumoniae]|nr:propanediol utilization transcriptional activator [Klebsiella pneumoniae]SYN80167.1 propanediol utilization transcriptional activator [Klebsiella pneumoniae]